jgi:hypothetical protein
VEQLAQTALVWPGDARPDVGDPSVEQLLRERGRFGAQTRLGVSARLDVGLRCRKLLVGRVRLIHARVALGRDALSIVLAGLQQFLGLFDALFDRRAIGCWRRRSRGSGMPSAERENEGRGGDRGQRRS